MKHSWPAAVFSPEDINATNQACRGGCHQFFIIGVPEQQPGGGSLIADDDVHYHTGITYIMRARANLQQFAHRVTTSF